MNEDPHVTLTRDVIAILIPRGTKVELPEGQTGVITQALGGSYTIQMEGHLFRIDGKDADAIGRQPSHRVQISADANVDELEKAMWEQLHTCYDPEIPVDIVELGLVYEASIVPLTDPDDHKTRKAVVRMTLTAPGCGMGEILVAEIRDKMLALPTVVEADVELVFDPPWNQTMMSDEARLATGMF
ncbi:putative Fe-S cluster assembly protein SufT [Sinimarinibacterium sp. NLF-5-8]|uniref:putative Fe-S cluster assembly protein SufT n=1 Tax=Sinimarinibacterium sp. NLF-5-8 TaxID=2698684 RepID=UPI00137BAE4B|nr:putative Fe-S cluster assembly protein SufT [Sinimarinibacterium sp. NLF-5-8]QHS10701.1 putative Fe-S cluster assembly protein SufT [Sinimarinibacterium sp. NLF-5-8]